MSKAKVALARRLAVTCIAARRCNPFNAAAAA